MPHGVTKLEQAPHGTWAVTTPLGKSAAFSHQPAARLGSVSGRRTFPPSDIHHGSKGLAGRSKPHAETVSSCTGRTNCSQAHPTVPAEEDKTSVLNLSQFPGRCRQQSFSHPLVGGQGPALDACPSVKSPKRRTPTTPCLPLSWSWGAVGAFLNSPHTGPFARQSYPKPNFLWAKVAQLPQPPLSPLLTGTCWSVPSPPAGWEQSGPWNVSMLPRVRGVKGLEVIPVLAAPRDGAEGAAESSGRAAPPPGDTARAPGAAVMAGQATTSTSEQSKPLCFLSCSDTIRGLFCPCCFSPQLSFIIEAPAGQRHQTDRGTSRVGMRDSAIGLEHP